MPLSWIRLFEGSEEYARELGERLKERVFEEIFPHFARGFIEDIRRKEANIELNQETLDKDFPGNADVSISSSVSTVRRSQRSFSGQRSSRLLGKKPEQVEGRDWPCGQESPG